MCTRRLLGVSLGVIVGLTFCVSALAGETPPGTWVVDGDAEFGSLPDVYGTGSVDDPFVLTGVFDAQGSPFGLLIRNTSAHFVVRDALFRGATEAGLRLEEVQNGWIVRCVFEDNTIGASVDDASEQVTFALNTFRQNSVHATDRSSQVQWDDGYVGNWWEGYAGEDANGDGIGAQPWEVSTPGTFHEQLDRFPLVAPLAGAEPPQEGVLLQVAHTVGERFVRTVEMEFELVVDVMGLRFPLRTRSEMVVEAEVASARGAGSFFEIVHTILKDSGTSHFMGTEDDYVSDAGSTYRTRAHRFGDFDALTGEPIDRGGVPGMAWPARWITVGHRWNHVLEIDAEALGFPGSVGVFQGTGVLNRLEQRDGRTLAVVLTEGTYEVETVEEDPDLGRTTLILSGTFAFVDHVDLATGRAVEEKATIRLEGDMTMDGEYLGTTHLAMTMTAREHER